MGYRNKDTIADTVNRDVRIDIVKSLAIILMVYGHTFGKFREFIYLFHMPVFFMVSGYCWSHRHSSSDAAFSSYFLNRATRLLVPYYVCNLLVTILINAFISLNFYTSDPRFLMDTAQAPIGQVTVQEASLRQIAINCYKILYFRYTPPQLAGGTWFLYTLFIVGVACCGVHCLLRRIKSPIFKNTLMIVLFLLFCLLSWMVSEGFGQSSIEPRHRRLFAPLVCYMVGLFMRTERDRKRERTPQVTKKANKYSYLYIGGIVAFITLIILNNIGKIELSECQITNPAFLIVCMLCGWVVLYAIADIISRTRCSLIFEYVGKHTMPIVCIHFIAFKLVSIIIVAANKLPLYMTASYPIVFGVSEGVKIVYTVEAIIIPLLLYAAYEKIRLKKSHREISDTKST